MPLSATARAIIVRHSQQPFHFQKNIPQKFIPGIIVIQKKNNTCHDQITI